MENRRFLGRVANEIASRDFASEVHFSESSGADDANEIDREGRLDTTFGIPSKLSRVGPNRLDGFVLSET